MRIVIVDDDTLICDSLGIILGAQPDIEVSGSGRDGNDAVRLYRELSPDVLLLDIQMPGRDGLSAAEEILASSPDARVVFLTTFSDDEYIVRALRAGARGYLIKQDAAAIAPALRAVMRGQSVLEGEVLERLPFIAAAPIEGGHTRAAATPGATLPLTPARPKSFALLTEREYEVARLVAEGLDNKEISATAYMGEGTVRNHISSILAKLHLKNRTQIAVAYWRGQLLE